MHERRVGFGHSSGGGLRAQAIGRSVSAARTRSRLRRRPKPALEKSLDTIESNPPETQRRLASPLLDP